LIDPVCGCGRAIAIAQESLAHLRGLTKLPHLPRDHTRVSDSGLAHLEGLLNLHVLRLNHTQTTDDGMKELKRALPDLTMYR
jgi:hypothetical protein